MKNKRQSTPTLVSLQSRYAASDRKRICLAGVVHPKCGPYLCELSKGHEMGSGLRAHQASCRKHHGCIISWEESKP
jgi:hypothetical protein